MFFLCFVGFLQVHWFPPTAQDNWSFQIACIAWVWMCVCPAIGWVPRTDSRHHVTLTHRISGIQQTTVGQTLIITKHVIPNTSLFFLNNEAVKQSSYREPIKCMVLCLSFIYILSRIPFHIHYPFRVNHPSLSISTSVSKGQTYFQRSFTSYPSAVMDPFCKNGTKFKGLLSSQNECGETTRHARHKYK